MDAGPERVFDLFYQKSMQGQGQGQPAASGERVLWPTLTVLSCISSDRLSSSSNNDGSGSNPGGGLGGGGAGGSKTNLGFGGQMRHASAASRYSLRFNGDIVRQLKSQGKLAEVALVCALDTCRVASHVRAGLHVDSEDETDFAGDVPLREVAMDFAHEIKASSSSSVSLSLMSVTGDDDPVTRAQAILGFFGRVGCWSLHGGFSCAVEVPTRRRCTSHFHDVCGTRTV